MSYNSEYLAVVENTTASTLTVADFVNNSSSPISVVGSGGHDILLGGSGNDTLSGNAGNDFLSGGSGNDVINGGFGDDVLIGGTGTDQLTGSAGADAFRLDLSDRTTTLSDVDVVKDFSAAETDTLQVLSGGEVLDQTILRGDGSGYQSADFKGGTALNTNTGWLVNSGSNSADLNISTIESELQAGDTSNTITAGDNFFYTTDDGASSRVFYYSDSNRDGDINAGEVSAVFDLDDVSDATGITADLVIGFS